MPLSEDLGLMEAFVGVVAAGEHALTVEGARELRILLARAAADAAQLEDGLERARALAGLDPGSLDAYADGLRSGKVASLAAVRLGRRLPAAPGWGAP